MLRERRGETKEEKEEEGRREGMVRDTTYARRHECCVLRGIPEGNTQGDRKTDYLSIEKKETEEGWKGQKSEKQAKVQEEEDEKKGGAVESAYLLGKGNMVSEIGRGNTFQKN